MIKINMVKGWPNISQIIVQRNSYQEFDFFVNNKLSINKVLLYFNIILN